MISTNTDSFHLVQHPQGKILGPPGWGDDTVGDRLAQFRLCCPRLLRDREVLLQSGGAPHGNGAADPDQLAGLGVQDLFVLVVEKLLADVHVVSSPSPDKQDKCVYEVIFWKRRK